MKTCSRCAESLTLTAFPLDSSKPSGRYPVCTFCRTGVNLRVKVWRGCKCGKLFRPRLTPSGYVKHCSRACATRFGEWAGSNNASWIGDAAGYYAVHNRLARLRPKSCSNCGATDRLIQWALDHARCSAPLKAPEGPYSLDPADYVGLCVPCHKRMDLAR